MGSATDAVEGLALRLRAWGRVTDLWVAGSLATGDHVPGVSDLDLVALVRGTISSADRRTLHAIHVSLDDGVAAGTDLGCQYADAGRLLDPTALHPTWTHGAIVERIVSGITRAELVRHGYAVLGRPPAEVLPSVSDDDVRRAAQDEILGTGHGRRDARACG